MHLMHHNHCQITITFVLPDANTLYKTVFQFFIPIYHDIIQVFREARRVAPSIVYLPRINTWWEVTPETFRATLFSVVYSLPPTTPLLVLATAECPYGQLPATVRELFKQVCVCVWGGGGRRRERERERERERKKEVIKCVLQVHMQYLNCTCTLFGDLCVYLSLSVNSVFNGQCQE